MSSRGKKNPRYLAKESQQIKETKRLRAQNVEIIEQPKREIKKKRVCEMFEQNKEIKTRRQEQLIMKMAEFKEDQGFKMALN